MSFNAMPGSIYEFFEMQNKSFPFCWRACYYEVRITNMLEREAVPQFPSPQEPIQRPKQTEKSRGGLVEFLWETIKIVAISLVIIVPVRYYLVQPFFVKGQSMEPNFHDKDYLIVDKLSYRLDNPKRGDVIVFEYPYDTSEHFIKRIVGLPGETIEVKENTVKIFNSRYPEGLLLDEKTCPRQTKLGEISEQSLG
jgi:signal peptidase I